MRQTRGATGRGIRRRGPTTRNVNSSVWTFDPANSTTSTVPNQDSLPWRSKPRSGRYKERIDPDALLATGTAAHKGARGCDPAGRSPAESRGPPDPSRGSDRFPECAEGLSIPRLSSGRPLQNGSCAYGSIKSVL